MISTFDNCLFIHIPKVAGQSIESIFVQRAGLSWQQRGEMLLRPNDNPELGPPRLAHLTAQEYLSLKYTKEADFNQMHTFAFVRNPWERLVSEYQYRKYSFSFKDFLFKYFPKPDDDDYDNAKDAYRHIMPQYQFICDQHGEVMVDFVGKFESLESDFSEVSKIITGQPLELPHKNQTSTKGIKKMINSLNLNTSKSHYSTFYDNESREFVAEMYEKDIVLFGYEFSSKD